MPNIQKFVSVVHRHLLTIDSKEAYLLPLIEPLLMIETHLSFEERNKLFAMGMGLRQGFEVCEIGSYLGASTCFLALAASFREGRVHAVDTWKNDHMPHEPVVDTWGRFIENTWKFSPWITAHRGEAHEVKDQVPQVDLLFVDGDHSYEGTLSHLKDYVPKIVPGGFLAMHDFIEESVQAACRDYFQDHLKDRASADLGQTNTLRVYKL